MTYLFRIKASSMTVATALAAALTGTASQAGARDSLSLEPAEAFLQCDSGLGPVPCDFIENRLRKFVPDSFVPQKEGDLIFFEENREREELSSEEGCAPRLTATQQTLQAVLVKRGKPVASGGLLREPLHADFDARVEIQLDIKAEIEWNVLDFGFCVRNFAPKSEFTVAATVGGVLESDVDVSFAAQVAGAPEGNVLVEVHPGLELGVALVDRTVEAEVQALDSFSQLLFDIAIGQEALVAAIDERLVQGTETVEQGFREKLRHGLGLSASEPLTFLVRSDYEERIARDAENADIFLLAP